MKKSLYFLLLFFAFLFSTAKSNGCNIHSTISQISSISQNLCDKNKICSECNGMGMKLFQATVPSSYYRNGQWITGTETYSYWSSCNTCNGSGYTDGNKVTNPTQAEKPKPLMDFTKTADNLILGKWQYTHTDFTTYRFTHQLNMDGTALYDVEFDNPLFGWKSNFGFPKTFYWNYTPTATKTGVLEQFSGGDLVNRYTILWTGPHSFTARLEQTTEFILNKSGVYYFTRS